MRVNDDLRVAALIIWYHPNIGGAETVLAEVSPVLRMHNVSTHVVTRQFGGLPLRETIDGISVYRTPSPGSTGAKRIDGWSFLSASLLELHRTRPDIVHAHYFLSTTIAALMAKAILRRPVVVTAHRSGQIGDVQTARRSAFGRLLLALMRRHVDAFVCISREVDEELASCGIPPSRRHVIPNAVDTSRFRPVSAAERTRLRSTLGLEEGPTAVFTGRLSWEKRVDLLVTLWPQIRQAVRGAQLVVVGGGPEEQRLRSVSGPGVSLVGPVHDVAPYLQAADVFVLPSVAEGHSIALLEAQATGLACIATCVGGNADTIVNGRNGILVGVDNRHELSSALKLLLGDTALSQRLGRASREVCEREYSMQAMARKLRTVYDHVLHRQRNLRG